MTKLEELKMSLIDEVEKRVSDKIIESTNATLLIKLINNAESETEAMAIAELGTTYKRTGFHFDKRLEKVGSDIRYLVKNKVLSFVNNEKELTHKLIIGDNYYALQNLLVTYKGKIDIIYIDPPYGKDSMGEFADTNYTNSLTRDNLLSMLYPRLQLAKLLMSEYGVIYCSIDDKNQAYLKCLFDDIFGEENFIGLLCIDKCNSQNDAVNMQKSVDYVLTYCKQRKFSSENGKLKEVPLLREGKYVNKKVIKEGNSYYYIDREIHKTGSNSLLINRKNLGYVIYYNKDSKDIVAKMDYKPTDVLPDSTIDIYSFDKELLSKGYVPLLPPLQNGKLGRWTWEMNKVNREKSGLIVTSSNIVKKKIFVNADNVIEKDNEYYFEDNTLTKNTKSLWSFSSANGTSQMINVLQEKIFDNPKNVEMIQKLIEIYRESKSPIVLDFFAGSGTTGQAVLELNREDGGNRQFILCTNNEITDTTPNGIAYDVTTKRLKRVMSGTCYDGSSDFKWIENNEPYGDNLEVTEISFVNNKETRNGLNAFEVIDETLYGIKKFDSIEEKINWVCNNFENTQKYLNE